MARVNPVEQPASPPPAAGETRHGPLVIPSVPPAPSDPPPPHSVAPPSPPPPVPPPTRPVPGPQPAPPDPVEPPPRDFSRAVPPPVIEEPPPRPPAMLTPPTVNPGRASTHAPPPSPPTTESTQQTPPAPPPAVGKSASAESRSPRASGSSMPSEPLPTAARSPDQLPTADLAQIKGIGPQTQAMLAESGIHTVQDLAEADPDALATLPRVGRRRAAEWIQAAANHEEHEA
jgi:predicted flap endonuclease-1-like 5' DNA nuclease